MRVTSTLLIFAAVSSTRTAAQEHPWRSGVIVFADDRSVEAEIAFRSASRSAQGEVVESDVLTDTLWLFVGSDDAIPSLLAAPSSDISFLAFQYEPRQAGDGSGRIEMDRRILLLSTRNELVWPAFHPPQSVPEELPSTVAVVTRVDDGSVQTYRFDEFFAAPVPNAPQSERISAIMFPK